MSFKSLNGIHRFEFKLDLLENVFRVFWTPFKKILEKICIRLSLLKGYKFEGWLTHMIYESLTLWCWIIYQILTLYQELSFNCHIEHWLGQETERGRKGEGGKRERIWQSGIITDVKDWFLDMCIVHLVKLWTNYYVYRKEAIKTYKQLKT